MYLLTYPQRSHCATSTKKCKIFFIISNSIDKTGFKVYTVVESDCMYFKMKYIKMSDHFYNLNDLIGKSEESQNEKQQTF